MPTDSNGMTTRKRRHIDVRLDDRVTYVGVTTGWNATACRTTR